MWFWYGMSPEDLGQVPEKLRQELEAQAEQQQGQSDKRMFFWPIWTKSDSQVAAGRRLDGEQDAETRMWFWYGMSPEDLEQVPEKLRQELEAQAEQQQGQSDKRMFFWPIWTKSDSQVAAGRRLDGEQDAETRLWIWSGMSPEDEQVPEELRQELEAFGQSDKRMFFWPIWTARSNSADKVSKMYHF